MKRRCFDSPIPCPGKDVPIRMPVSGLLKWYLGARGLEWLTMNTLLVEFVGENTRLNGSFSYSRC